MFLCLFVLSKNGFATHNVFGLWRERIDGKSVPAWIHSRACAGIYEEHLSADSLNNRKE